MKVKVLGSSGAELPGYNSPAFLVDGKVLLDAGTIGAALSESKQWEVRDILITHSHLDHIKAIPFLADNIIISQRKHSVTLYGTKETLKTLRNNLLNDKLWPDFTKDDLFKAIASYQKRERRFGLTSEQLKEKNIPN